MTAYEFARAITDAAQNTPCHVGDWARKPGNCHPNVAKSWNSTVCMEASNRWTGQIKYKCLGNSRDWWKVLKSIELHLKYNITL